MTRPNIQIPNEFAINGEKADFTQEKIQTGFDKLNPDIFAGDNINKFIDDTYKGLNGVLDLYNGVVLHDMTTTYDDKAVVGKFIENSFKLYRSLVNDNTGHEVTETEYWVEVALGGGSGFNLFDTKISDHILEGNEALGWALQGTYVYKEGVPGSRYGYPDFYNRCVEEFEDGGNTLLSIKNNVEVVGSPVVNNGVLSGFSTSNYVKLPQIFNPGSSTWEIVIPFSVDNLDTEQSIFMSCIEGSALNRYLLLAVEPNTGEIRCYYNYEQTNWQTTGSFGAENTISTGKKYWVKVEYDGTNLKGYLSTNGSDYTLCLNEEIAIPATASTNNITTLGLYAANEKTMPLNGSIDLKECYIKIDNELWWSGATTVTKNPNGHIFYDIKDKEAVDDWFDTYGIADFYGVDKENERIFLPRNSKFFQFTTDTTKVNDMVEAGLPNIEAKDSIGFSDDNPQSDLPPFVYADNVGNTTGGSSPEKRFRFDASTANPIYGKSDTVQPPSSLKLLYYVVGNTDVQSAATDIVDVTTSENDTTPLFTGHYFNFKPNNPCWLKAGEQANNGGLYASTYSTLVQELTDPVYNLKVIKTEDMQAGVDYSLYWKVDQDAQTFTTPTKLGNEGMFSTACKGNGVTLGLTNGSGSYGFGYSTNAANYNQTNSGLYGTPIGTQLSGQPNNWPYNSSLGITPDPTKSGIVPHIEVPESWNLYFKVSNALENLEVINVGQILEALTDKLDKNHSNDTKPYIVEQYQNPNVGTAAGNAGYRKWSNGMMEQWASSDSIGPNSKTTISFLIPFYQNACVYAQQITGGHDSSAGTWSVDAVSNNNFELINYTDVISAVYWFAIGRYQ